jgi:hypothetical protein
MRSECGSQRRGVDRRNLGGGASADDALGVREAMERCCPDNVQVLKNLTLA